MMHCKLECNCYKKSEAAVYKSCLGYLTWYRKNEHKLQTS